MYLLPAFCSYSKLLVVMFELFLGGVVKHSKRAIALQVCIYDKSLIVTVESDTMETSLVHCLEHCYSCCALVTIRGNELVIFHGIALYSDDKYILVRPICRLPVYRSVRKDSKSCYRHTHTHPHIGTQKIL